ncbi:HAD family hydrolase [Paraburkholderia sp. LEh10]|jgi:histidinol-phosphate phosphatase family protein|uniref:D-glycero-alpha-D-manno-heptose-1,7-bisphosphate 7-phosphatase n=1 Tax=Paraburkholderia sp. LEh10 TaxID=2821353 RepID=UPI001AE2AB07|nr:HAD family hydrolase [Paraburkholderia sp. LEh10]MBP0590288.1 HAD family hydrolase [Paraburkholderia sp. LEh10]
MLTPAAAQRRAAVFIDKDGTLLEDEPYNVDPERMRLAPGACEALSEFACCSFKLIVISNQSGVALGRFEIGALDAVEAKLREMFASCGATLDAVYWCPHHPAGQVAGYSHACDCRKPAPGMLLRAAREHRIDLRASWFVGDILDDVEAGNVAGCKTILLDNGHETVWQRTQMRMPTACAPDLHRAALMILRYEERCHAKGSAPTASQRAA